MKVSINAHGSHVSVEIGIAGKPGDGLALMESVRDLWKFTVDNAPKTHEDTSPAFGYQAERRESGDRFEWGMGDGRQPSIRAAVYPVERGGEADPHAEPSDHRHDEA